MSASVTELSAVALGFKVTTIFGNCKTSDNYYFNLGARCRAIYRYSPAPRKEVELAGVAKDIFSRQQFITYIDLCEQIQAQLDVKDRTAKTYIKFMREKEIILKDPSNQSYYIIGHQL